MLGVRTIEIEQEIDDLFCLLDLFLAVLAEVDALEHEVAQMVDGGAYGSAHADQRRDAGVDARATGGVRQAGDGPRGAHNVRDNRVDALRVAATEAELRLLRQILLR